MNRRARSILAAVVLAVVTAAVAGALLVGDWLVGSTRQAHLLDDSSVGRNESGRVSDLPKTPEGGGFLGGFRVLGHARENELAHVLGLDLGGFGFVHELREKPRDLDRMSDLRKVAGAFD
jgi:hypothetical protein